MCSTLETLLYEMCYRNKVGFKKNRVNTPNDLLPDSPGELILSPALFPFYVCVMQRSHNSLKDTGRIKLISYMFPL